MNTRSLPEHSLSIDEAAIRTYCEVVFGYLEGLAPLRFLSESGTPHQTPRLEFPAAKDVAARLIAMAKRAADAQRAVYVVPGTVGAPGSARAEDILQTGVVLVDLDTGDIGAARDHLVQHLGTPSLEVASGGLTASGEPKLHLYWRLTEAAEGADLARVARLRAAIAAKVGGDGAFGSIHQPIRVAGTVHGKSGKQAPVRLIEHDTVEYELAEFAEVVAAMPSLANTAPVFDIGHPGKAGPSAKALATRRIRAGDVDEISRFEAISRVIGHWLRNVRLGQCPLDDAREAVLDHNRAMIDPPWEDARVLREFEALRKRDIERNGAFPHTAATDASEGDPAGHITPPPQSEDALAATFVDDQAGLTRHVAAWGRWFTWTGPIWERDEVGHARERMRQVCRAAAASLPTEKLHEARRTASDKTIAAALRIAASDPRVAARASEWDTHTMLLNTPAGVVDLESGEITPHDPALHLTQMTSASPGEGCTRWHEFLASVTDGDVELQAYLQRLAGYCLTGVTREQMFAFLHGTGANGKSVFLETIAGILGSYAATAGLDTFMASKANRHLTELAGLRAARLVIVSETEAGRSWSEARIKSVTGGENIRANFMRCDHFEFRPQFKLVVMGNHRPGLSSVGEAMRRRLQIVPFTVTIPPEKRDGRLPERLLAERDGILSWMIEGCAEWQRSGLNPPDCVQEAAEEYFTNEDFVGQWIAECCHLGAALKTQSSTLYGSWRTWADANGYAAGSAKSLGEALRSRGLRDGRVNRGRGWFGIGLARSVDSQEVSA